LELIFGNSLEEGQALFEAYFQGDWMNDLSFDFHHRETFNESDRQSQKSLFKLDFKPFGRKGKHPLYREKAYFSTCIGDTPK